MSQLDRIRRGVSAFKRELARPQSQPSPKAGRPKIGLALGGGFARGIAHIGVIKVFEQEGIPIDFIAGTSSGALIGAMYCSGIKAKELEEIVAVLKFSDFARWTVSRMGLCNNDRMGPLMLRILKVQTFEELRTPLAVSATDFRTGEPVVFNSGPLIDPLRASCAYPAVFSPVNVEGRLMVDGLLAHPVPTTPLKQMGADRVCAVYFNSHWVGDTGPKHAMEVIGQCFSIAQAKMSSSWKADADLILQPDVAAYSHDAFSKTSELVKAGEQSALDALPIIKSWIEGFEEVCNEAKTKQWKTSIPPGTVPVEG